MSLISRREFLKDAFLLSSGIVGVPYTSIRFESDSPRGYEIEPGIYQLPDGKVPLEDYQIQEGDDIGKIAQVFHTFYDLIVEVNKLDQTGGIRPGMSIKIPVFAKEPMRYIPEAGIIRHQLGSADTARNIAGRYDIPQWYVELAFINPSNVVRTKSDSVLLLRNINPSPLDFKIDINDVTSERLSENTVRSLVTRVFHIYLYETGGDNAILRYVKNNGMKVAYGAFGFSPPNSITVLSDKYSSEIDLLRELGHELWHLLPFPWWSAGSDEGTAGYAASEWATRNHSEYNVDDTNRIWYSDRYYEKVNNPMLQDRIFKDRPVENRILATKAWQRIESKYPGVIAHLLQSAVHYYDTTMVIEPNIPFSLDLIRSWTEAQFGSDAWKYISRQYILFTK